MIMDEIFMYFFVTHFRRVGLKYSLSFVYLDTNDYIQFNQLIFFIQYIKTFIVIAYSPTLKFNIINLRII